jgi:DNA end-binding protein Ku
MARAIWKGAISFGLVHIPVAVVSATSSQGINFDWLDERSMDRVGYQKINKATGKPINKEHIVKGVELEKGQYVVLSEDDIKAALPEATQSIDIFSFVKSADIPLLNIHKPYFLSPGRRGEKVYALLRETLINTKKVALAYVVIRTKQRLAAVIPLNGALVMVLLRWPAEVHSIAKLDLTDAALTPQLAKKELQMAERLVEDMSAAWQPDEYINTFDDAIMQLVEEKARQGDIEQVQPTDDTDERPAGNNVLDLTELLKRSLAGTDKQKEKARTAQKPAKTTAKKPARSKKNSASDSKAPRKKAAGS